MTPLVVLTVAGTDSGGAAGIAADLATFAALGVHGACTVTAVTAQDTLGVRGVHRVPEQQVAAQLEAVLDDLPVAAAKTGMLGSAAAVRLVARRLAHLPLVVDPVLVATTGQPWPASRYGGPTSTTCSRSRPWSRPTRPRLALSSAPAPRWALSTWRPGSRSSARQW